MRPQRNKLGNLLTGIAGKKMSTPLCPDLGLNVNWSLPLPPTRETFADPTDILGPARLRVPFLGHSKKKAYTVLPRP